MHRSTKAEKIHACNDNIKDSAVTSNLNLVDIPKRAVLGWTVLVRITAAGVTPSLYIRSDNTTCEGAVSPSNEGRAWWRGRRNELSCRSRVMFTGQWAPSEMDTYSEWLAAATRNLCLISATISRMFSAAASRRLPHRSNEH